MIFRTDLAHEAKKLWENSAAKKTKLEGVAAHQTEHYGRPVDVVQILDERGARSLGKPMGKYLSLDLSDYFWTDHDGFCCLTETISKILHELLPHSGNLLVVGLGNREITPDSVGPRTLDHLLVTRHLKETEISGFSALGCLSAVSPGVLGKTGVESLDLVRGIISTVAPDCIIAVDALASCHTDGLCRSVQITDTGIVPGSGIGNGRKELNRDLLGIPVVAIGVPTVVDASNVCGEDADALPEDQRGLILSTADIDLWTAHIGKLIGYSINRFIHPALSVGDLSMLLA